MKYLIKIVVTTLLCFHSLSASDPIDTFIQFSEELRQDLTLSPELEKERQQALLQQILLQIPDFEAHSKLEKAVSAFAKKSLKASYKIVNSKTTALHGNSDDEVFFLYSKQGRLQYVIKAFKEPETSESSFIPELSGNSLLVKMELPNIETTRFIAIGKATIDSVGYGLLLETAVSGMRIDQYIYALNDIGDETFRNEIFRETTDAFTAIGVAFAQMHQTDDENKQPISKKWIKKIESDLQLLEKPEIVEKLHDQIDLEALKTFVQKKIQEIESAPFSISYQFGSAHLKNIFYESESGRIAFIDTGKLHYSVDKEGLPLGDPGYDLARLEEYLKRISIGYLNKEEVQLLINAFTNGYESIHPLPDEQLLEFYNVHLALHKMLNYSDYMDAADPKERESNFQIFQEHLNDLKERIHS